MAGRKDDSKLFKGKIVTPMSALAALHPPSAEDFARMRQVAEVEYPAAMQAAQLRGLFTATGELPAFLDFCKGLAPAMPATAPAATAGSAEQNSNKDDAHGGKGPGKK